MNKIIGAGKTCQNDWIVWEACVEIIPFMMKFFTYESIIAVSPGLQPSAPP
jgi:hypothetical protein